MTNKCSRRFWIPTPNKKVLDDFRRLFDAQIVNLDMFMMASAGNFVMLVRPIKDSAKRWSHLKSHGKWLFFMRNENEKSQKESLESSEKPQFIVVNGWEYNIQHVTLSARILGGEVYLYTWQHGSFRPLVLVGEKKGCCGAIAVPSYLPYEEGSNALRLNNVARKSTLNAISLNLRQIERLKKEFDLPMGVTMVFPQRIVSSISGKEFSEAQSDEVKSSLRYERKCGKRECNNLFYCQGECGIWQRTSVKNDCYCPECARMSNIAKPGEKDHCESRFGQQATSRMMPKIPMLTHQQIKALEKDLKCELQI